MSKQIGRWFPKETLCEGEASGFTTVGIREIRPALLLLLNGTALSLVLMFIEIVMQKPVIRKNTFNCRPRYQLDLNDVPYDHHLKKFNDFMYSASNMLHMYSSMCDQ